MIIKKVFKILVISVLGFSFLFPDKLIFSDEIADPNDIFYVSSPSANQTVKGNININWRMFDNQQQVIQYSIKLFDRASCKDTYYGDIATSSNGVSNAQQDNQILWDTKTTSTTSNLADGFYCIQVCASLLYGETPYSACNGREVIIVNNNRSPQIISVPPADNRILESESWQYQVQASDPDAQALTYRLIYTTNFLSINSQSGLISTNSNPKTLPAGVYNAQYNLAVEVKDIFGATAIQNFTLIIEKPVPQSPSNPTTPEDNGSNEEEITNLPSDITIISPDSNSILKGNSNKIEWEISDNEGLKKLIIDYSKDLTDWQNITSVTDESKLAQGNYIWDVTSLTDSDYYLRIKAIDSKNVETSKTSDLFKIQNLDNPSNGEESQPLIINIRPENNSSTNNPRPVIYGEFTPSKNNTIKTDTFTLKLDEANIVSTCTLTIERFSCTLTQDLAVGSHKLEAEIKDSSDKKASQAWVFTVSAPNIDTTQQGDIVIIFGRQIPRNTLIILIVICLICIILLIIPWLIYSIWSRRDREEDEKILENSASDVYNPSGFTTYPQINNLEQPVSQPQTNENPYPVFENPTITTNYYSVPDSTAVDNSLNQPVTEPPVINNPDEFKIDDPISQANPDNSDITSFEEFMKKYPELSSGMNRTTEPQVENNSINLPENNSTPDLGNKDNKSDLDVDSSNLSSVNSENNLDSDGQSLGNDSSDNKENESITNLEASPDDTVASNSAVSDLNIDSAENQESAEIASQQETDNTNSLNNPDLNQDKSSEMDINNSSAGNTPDSNSDFFEPKPTDETVGS